MNFSKFELAEIFHMSTMLDVEICSINANGSFHKKLCHKSICTFGAACSICNNISQSPQAKACCDDAHLYALLQANCGDGSYVYFCPCGFSFIIAPILISNEKSTYGCAYVKVGPFLTTTANEFLTDNIYELANYFKMDMQSLVNFITSLPVAVAQRAQKLAQLLQIAMNGESSFGQQAVPGGNHINEMLQVLQGIQPVSYFESKKKELVAHLAKDECETSITNALINDILGYIFFQSEAQFDVIRANVLDMMMALCCAYSSKTAADFAAEDETLKTKLPFLYNSYFEEAYQLKDIDELCDWLAGSINSILSYTSRMSNAKNTDIIKKSINYIKSHYQNKLSLEEVSAAVYLSPTYFSKVFCDNVGLNFSDYLNQIRIEKSKKLLISAKSKSQSLTQIALSVGYENQSYFNKVFKKYTGTTPGKYRLSIRFL